MKVPEIETVSRPGRRDLLTGSTRREEGAPGSFPSREDAACSRRGLWVRGGVLCFLLLAYGGSWFLTAADLPAGTACPLRGLSGLPCPSCGFTRGFVAISHGELERALELNVLAPAVYLLGLLLVPFLLYELWSRRDVVDRFLCRHRRVVYVALLVAMLARYGALMGL